MDVFRPPHELPGIVDQAIANGAKAVWFQLRLINFEAADKAREAGLVAVMDKCIKMLIGLKE